MNPKVIQLILSCIVSFILSILIIPIIIKIAKKKNLVDIPNHRASHSTPTPTFGGIGIFISFIVVVFAFIPVIGVSQIQFLLATLIILFITGVRDDLKEIKASTKFTIQFIAAFFLAHSGIRIESLCGILGFYSIPTSIQYLITIIVITGTTNAVNLIDGIDGLAGGIGFINACIFGVLFSIKGDYVFGIISLSLAGGILGFLKYNFNPAKIFMGDTGSLIIGFLLATMGIKYLQNSYVNNPNNLILVFGILILPIFDTLRVFTIRIIKKKSPFSADKNHIHHLLIKTGYDHKVSAIVMYIANLTIIGCSFLFFYFRVQINISIILLFSLTVTLSELLTVKRILQFKKKVNDMLSKKKESQTQNQLLTKLN